MPLFSMADLYNQNPDKKQEFSINPNARHQNMPPDGLFKLGILVIGEAPGEEEDREGRPFVGPTGQTLRAAMKKAGIDMSIDCLTTNVVTTHPANNVFPKDTEIGIYKKRLYTLIEEKKPVFILCVGLQAAKAIFGEELEKTGLGMAAIHGATIPSYRWNCMVGIVQHPSYIHRQGFKEFLGLFETEIFEYFWEFSADKYPRPRPDYVEFKALLTPEEFRKEIMRYKEITFDIETTGLDARTFEFLCVSFRPSIFQEVEGNDTVFVAPLKKPEMLEVFKEFCASDCRKIIHNAQFENSASLYKFGFPIRNVVLDTMTAAFILDTRIVSGGEEGKTNSSLGAQTFLNFNRYYKGMVDRSRLSSASQADLFLYSAFDSYYTSRLSFIQADKARTRGCEAAIDLFTKGQMLLSQYSYKGMKVDRPALLEFQAIHQQKQRDYIERIRSLDIVKKWQNQRGFSFNPAGDDLSDLLFKYLKLPVQKEGTSGKASTDIETLQELEQLLKPQETQEAKETLILIDNLKSLRFENKLKDTYIEGFLKCSQLDGLLHPELMLNTVATLRSSGKDPNPQNIPKRGPMKEIRRFIIPKLDCLLGVDFKGAEVNVIAIYSMDENLIQAINNKVDIHRQQAAEGFGVLESQVTPEMRNAAKMYLVFQPFYGGSINSIASDMGWPLHKAKEYLTRLQTAYPGVFEWHKKQRAFYEANGYVEMELGFRRPAPMKYNAVINTPIQGTSFHRLLAAGIKIENELQQRGLKSHGIVEIHDEIVFDCKAEEVDIVLSVCREHMINGQPKTDPIRFDFEAKLFEQNWFSGRQV